MDGKNGARKRRKKDTGQAKLSFGVNGMVVKRDDDDDIIPIDPPTKGKDSSILPTPSPPFRRKENRSSPFVSSPLVPSPPKRKRITFANDTKPAHSFFAKRDPPPQPQLQDVPPIDQIRVPTRVHDGWGCCKPGDAPPAPLPGGEWPSHVGYDPASPSPPVRRKTKILQPVGPDVPLRCLLSTPTPTRSIPTSTSYPPFILQHPAITSLSRSDSKEGWCEAHRPRRACAVLGNEVEATYLRDWLSALSIGSDGARRIIRRVPRRKSDPDKNWIVDDFNEFAEPFTDDAYYTEEEIPEIDEPQFPLGGRPESYPPIEYWIGNALLLTGPSGSGKSAAVYAAAGELGWDVFEVYPGIGRRTGSNLLSLVGEVGKNHMVEGREEKSEKEKGKEKKKKDMRGFFGSVAPRAGSAECPIAIDHTPVKAKQGPDVQADLVDYANENKNENDNDKRQTKQSLILIDEADILYEEESTFWPAVVALIAESRRPVVITCNDLSNIPRDSLPIHTTLYFQPPPPYLAQAYLSAIADIHGISIDPAALYAQCTRSPLDLISQPLPPNGHEPQPVFDLRAAIAQMQLARRGAGAVHTEPEEGEPVNLDDVLASLDSLSFADAFVAPRSWERMEMAEIDRYFPSTDDQDGIRLLLKPESDAPILAVNSNCANMAETIAPTRTSYPNFTFAQVQYTRHILPALDEVVTLASRLLPHPTLYTELTPYLRIMVRTDDALLDADRAAVEAGVARVNKHGRGIRGASRGYERRIVMEPGALAVAREVVFD